MHNSSRKAIRHIGCENIDFVGKNKRNNYKDHELAKAVIDVVANSKNKPDGWDGTTEQYCKERKWLSSKYTKDFEKCNLVNIPLLNMVETKSGNKKQYVFGRMSNLKEYYHCNNHFHTLDSNDWDALYQLNDLFVYCAESSKENDFPIRIVTDIKHGIHSKDEVSGVTSYTELLTLPHLLNQHSKIKIIARELCQITQYFKMHLYQSKEHKNIFFASKKSPDELQRKIKKFQLHEVWLS